MALNTSIRTDVYYFNSVGNALVRKETRVLPLPFSSVVPLRIGPDGRTYTYSKITLGTPPEDFYVGETVSALNTLMNA